MSRGLKKLGKLSAALCMSAVIVCPYTALAAGTGNDGNAIEVVEITINEKQQQPGTVWTVSVSADKTDYVVNDREWSTDPDKWEPGKKVELTMEVMTNGTFAKGVKVRITNAESVISVKRDGAGSLAIKANYIPRVNLAAPEGLHYTDESTLEWEEVEYAGGYDVWVYKTDENGAKSLYKKLTLDGASKTSVDLSGYADDAEGTVTASVRATSGSKRTAGISASEWASIKNDVGVDPSSGGDSGHSSGTSGSPGSGGSSGSGSGSRGTGSSQTPGSGSGGSDDDEIPSGGSGWEQIRSSWYYFDPETKKAVTSAWVHDGDNWYLLGTDGKMLTGWQKADGQWYCLNVNITENAAPYGAMLTGWVQEVNGGSKYWLNDGTVRTLPKGAMLTSAKTPDGHAVGADGKAE